MTERYIESAQEPDTIFEIPLRPDSLDGFVGQEMIKNRLEIAIKAAKQRGEALGHTLFSGPPGLGKTTLANILAKAMGTQIVITSGPVIEKPGDLAGILTNLQDGDFLFIDEIHRMHISVEEILYSAMEDYALDIIIPVAFRVNTYNTHLFRTWLVGKALSQEKRQTYVMFIQNGKAGYC